MVFDIKFMPVQLVREVWESDNYLIQVYREQRGQQSDLARELTELLRLEKFHAVTGQNGCFCVYFDHAAADTQPDAGLLGAWWHVMKSVNHQVRVGTLEMGAADQDYKRLQDALVDLLHFLDMAQFAYPEPLPPSRARAIGFGETAYR